MKSIQLIVAVVLLCGIAAAQGPQGAGKTQPKPTFAKVLNNSLSSVEHEFVDAADAMPGEKYEFAPTNGDFKGVRTFGEQVRHVAATNYLIAAAILGEKPPVDTGGESGPTTMTSKEDIMKYLRDSFAYMHKALSSITSEQQCLELVQSPFGPGQMPKMSLALLEAGHPFDHYGQMVEYLRMNNIIPPASRNQ